FITGARCAWRESPGAPSAPWKTSATPRTSRGPRWRYINRRGHRRIARNAKIAKIAGIEVLNRRERNGRLLPKARAQPASPTRALFARGGVEERGISYFYPRQSAQIRGKLAFQFWQLRGFGNFGNFIDESRLSNNSYHSRHHRSRADHLQAEPA